MRLSQSKSIQNNTEMPQPEDHIESKDNMLSTHPQNPHMNHSIRSPQFHPLTTGQRIESVSSNGVGRVLRMHSNPFNSTMNIDIIPGPISLRGDNIDFIKSWIKYICQSAISVPSH
eukprot:110639_1